MSKKINIRDIVKTLNNDKDYYNLKKIKWFNRYSKSSDSFDNHIADILQLVLPLLIVVTSSYYFLKSPNSQHPEKIQQALQKYQRLIIKRIGQTYSGNLKDKITNEYNAICNKFCIYNELRKNYAKKNPVIFDDRTSSHHKSFKTKKMSFPPNNILLKVNVFNVHIRCGIIIEGKKKESVSIINLSYKKSGNS